MKTSELTGAALDWAVVKCEGFDWYIETKPTAYGPKPFVFEEHGEASCLFQPSTRWAQGGPIIEREKIDRIATNVSGGFTASKKIVHLLDDDSFNVRWVHGSGSTLLIAAMRCYVASKLGDEVDVPEELTK